MSLNTIFNRSTGPLVLVCCAHAAALGALALGMARPEPIKPPQVITAVVLPPEPLPIVAPPSEDKPVPPKPQPVQKPKPQPAPLPPIKNAPPSPNAISTPPVEPVPPAPVEVAKAEPAPPPAPPAPVSPPRSDAAHLNNPAPAYPGLSRKLGEEGVVLLSVYILADGSVGEIKLKQSSGFGRLDDSALSAVKRWKFVPARQGDKTLAVWHTQPVKFSLES